MELVTKEFMERLKFDKFRVMGVKNITLKLSINKNEYDNWNNFLSSITWDDSVISATIPSKLSSIVYLLISFDTHIQVFGNHNELRPTLDNSIIIDALRLISDGIIQEFSKVYSSIPLAESLRLFNGEEGISGDFLDKDLIEKLDSLTM